MVGVAGFERGESPGQNEAKVADFLAKRADEVGFAIALDTDGSMSTDWMRAARRNGIPCSFVVGKDGKIAYIGSPNASLDRAIEVALGKEAPAPTPSAPKAAPETPPAVPAAVPPAAPAGAPSVTEEVTEEDTDQAGESSSTTKSTSTRTRTENGTTVTETVTETVTVTVKDGKKKTVKRREVTRSGAGAS